MSFTVKQKLQYVTQRVKRFDKIFEILLSSNQQCTEFLVEKSSSNSKIYHRNSTNLKATVKAAQFNLQSIILDQSDKTPK